MKELGLFNKLTTLYLIHISAVSNAFVSFAIAHYSTSFHAMRKFIITNAHNQINIWKNIFCLKLWEIRRVNYAINNKFNLIRFDLPALIVWHDPGERDRKYHQHRLWHGVVPDHCAPFDRLFCMSSRIISFRVLHRHHSRMVPVYK